MPQSISVVIIDSDPEAINRVVNYIKALGDSVSVEGAATTFEQGYELVHKKKPMVVILDVSGPKHTVETERITTILGRFPQTTIFAVCDDTSSDAILKTMRAGASEYLLKPVAESDLASALQKLGRLWIVKPHHEEEIGRIITIFSPKGGVGVTTLATNLATAIYGTTKKGTILVDLDLNAGDATTFLDIKPSYTISDVTLNMSRLDRNFLRGVITRHESGVSVLADPQRVEDAVSISREDLARVLSLLKTMFPYVVLDTESVMDDRTDLAIKMADTILLTFVLSLPGIRNIQRYLAYFEKKGYKEKVRLVVNRFHKKGEIKIQDAERVLNQEVFWSIPNDYDNAMKCLNKGVALSTGAPRSDISVSINELAKALTAKKR